MSENVWFYAAKMAERRSRLRGSGALRKQLVEIFEMVAQCEAMWSLEERIEKSR
jgi:hypothetical protein